MKTILSLALVLAWIPAIAGTNDVLLYRFAPNPDGIPTNWIAKVQPLPEGEPLPTLKSNWLRLSDAQLEALRAAARPAFDAWLASRDAAETTAKTTRAQLILDTIADLDTALENWSSITNTAQLRPIIRRLTQITRAMLKDELR